MGVPHAPGEAGTGNGVMLAVQHVTDPADRQAQRNADHGHIEQEAHRQAQPPGSDETRERRSRERPDHRGAPVPECDDRFGPRSVERPVVDDVEQARTGQSTSNDRRAEQVEALIADDGARERERDLAADEQTDESEQRVPGEGDAEESDPWVERQVDQGVAGLRERMATMTSIGAATASAPRPTSWSCLSPAMGVGSTIRRNEIV